MIDIDKIKEFHFYERYGIADLIFMFSKYKNEDVSVIINNYTEDDLIDYYNNIYRVELIHNFRMWPTLDISNKSITYNYIGSSIFDTVPITDKKGITKEKYYNVSSDGLADKSIFLSPHIISSSGDDCNHLFNFLNKEIINDGENIGAISPFVTKVRNKYKQSYNKFSKLEIIGQIIACTTKNKFYYRDKKYKKYNNAGIFPDFKNFNKYIELINYIYYKNVIPLFKTELKEIPENTTSLIDLKKKNINTKPPLVLNGNINKNLTYPFDSKYVFIDVYIEYCKEINNGELDDNLWYSISIKNINTLSFSIEVLETSIKHELDFSKFSKNLLKNKLKDSKGYVYLYDFYKHFLYKDLYKLLKQFSVGKENNSYIYNDNPIIIKFLKTMNKNNNDIIRDLIFKIKAKIFKIACDKCDKLGYEPNTDKYNKARDKYISDLNRTVFNYINTSNSIEDFLLSISKIINKYKVGNFADDKTIGYLLTELEDFEEMKKVSCIYLYTWSEKKEVNLESIESKEETSYTEEDEISEELEIKEEY